MSDVLTPEKTGRGWIMDIPSEMAKTMGVEEGSVIVLYPREGGMSYEILPPLPVDDSASPARPSISGSAPMPAPASAP